MHPFAVQATAQVSSVVFAATSILLFPLFRHLQPRWKASSHSPKSAYPALLTAVLLFTLIAFVTPANAIERHPVYAMGTIKPAKPGTLGHSLRILGERFEATNTSLRELISFAYGPQIGRIEAPAWVENEKFDVTAQSDSRKYPTEDQWKYMVQKLLSESFHLRCHRVRKITLRIDSSAASADVLIVDHVEKPYN